PGGVPPASPRGDRGMPPGGPPLPGRPGGVRGAGSGPAGAWRRPSRARGNTPPSPFRVPAMLAPDLFQSTFLRGPIGAYVLTPTPEAAVMAVNDRFLQWTGRKREGMVARRLFAVFPADPADPDASNASSLRD